MSIKGCYGPQVSWAQTLIPPTKHNKVVWEYGSIGDVHYLIYYLNQTPYLSGMWLDVAQSRNTKKMCS